MVIFMYHLAWAKVYPSGKILFLGMSLKEFPEKISRLSKDHLHQCSWASSKPLRAQIEQKDEEEQIFSLPLSCNVHQLCPWTLKHLILWLLTLRLIALYPFLILVTSESYHSLAFLALNIVATDHRSEFSNSIIMWTNSYNKYFIKQQILFLWRT